MAHYYISSGVISTGITLDRDLLYVYSGGVANSTTVNSDGWLRISSGGVANRTTVNSGCMYISSGGVANRTTVNSGGYLYISSGGVANRTTVNSGGSMRISSGGTATAITENGGYVSVAEGANVTFIPNIISGLVLSGWVLSGYHSYLSATLHSGTVAINTTVNWGGRVYISSGGVANSTTVNSMGALFISSGGVANSTTVNGRGYLYISSGGVANITTMNDGNLSITSGGVANRTTVNGGWMYISSGGVATSTTVNSGGDLYISSGGKHTGSLDIASGGVVSAYAGAIVDFDISNRTADDKAVINNLSLVKGTPTYTITVAGNQANGVYQLAAGASGFSGAISVGDGSITYGSVSLADTLTYNGVDYSLSNVDGNLNLTISGNAPVTVEQDRFFTGAFDGSATDMLMSVANGKASIYANNAGWTELLLDDGWNVVGVEDFNGDGKDDILRQHDSGLLIGEMSDGNTTFAPQVLNSVASGWAIEGTGDFNGDGVGDVLIANPTAASETVGLLGYWKGGTEWTLINGYSPEWEMIATGDFNNDGKTDMLWRNEFVGAGDLTYNAYCTWIVDNANDWRMVSVANPDEWDFLCSGDFNADDCNDIAMVNGDGVVGIWGVNDGYMNSWSILSAVTSEWELAGVGDFNADGTDDIAWCNTETGLTGYWQITNKTLASWQNIATVA